VEKELRYDFEQNRALTVNLFHPDFTTSTRLASLINAKVGDVDARMVDSSSVLVRFRNTYQGSVVGLVSVIENLMFPLTPPPLW